MALRSWDRFPSLPQSAVHNERNATYSALALFIIRYFGYPITPISGIGGRVPSGDVVHLEGVQ